MYCLKNYNGIQLQVISTANSQTHLHSTIVRNNSSDEYNQEHACHCAHVDLTYTPPRPMVHRLGVDYILCEWACMQVVFDYKLTVFREGMSIAYTVPNDVCLCLFCCAGDEIARLPCLCIYHVK